MPSFLAWFKRISSLVFLRLLEGKLGTKFLLCPRIPNDRQVVNTHLPNQFACEESSHDVLQALSLKVVFGKRNMRHPEVRFIIQGDSFSCRQDGLPHLLMEVGEFDRAHNGNVEYWMQTREQG